MVRNFQNFLWIKYIIRNRATQLWLKSIYHSKIWKFEVRTFWWYLKISQRFAIVKNVYITYSCTTDEVFGGMILKWSRRVPGPIKAVTAAVTFETMSSPFLVLLTLSGNGYEVTCTVKKVE